MSQKTIVVTGSNGFIGSKIIEYLSQNPKYLAYGWSIGDNRNLGSDFLYNNLDLTNYSEVESQFNQIKPDILIHCAAISQVDVCEKKPELCYVVNVDVTTHLVRLSEKYGSRIIHFSSDFVFNGRLSFETENSVPQPISRYGKSKYDAELVVEKASNWAVIRPVLVYGYSESASRGNIFTWILHSLRNKKSVKVVDDQFRTPTYVNDVVKLVVALINSNEVGYFHIGGEDRVSVYDFALMVSKVAGLDETFIKRVKSTDVEGAGLRPQNSCFENTRIRMVFDIKPIGLIDGVRESVQQII